jgi:hypothetical protein
MTDVQWYKKQPDISIKKWLKPYKIIGLIR